MTRDPFPLVFGVIVTTILSGTLVLAGLKAGITPGVSPLVILFAWGAFTRRIAQGGGNRFLNIAQVAGSAGMAVTTGVIFTAPLLQILYTDIGIEEATARGIELPLAADGTPDVGRELLAVLAANGLAVPPVDVPTLIFLSVAGALIGFGFVGLGTRKFLTDPTLPAPEARACEAMIETAVTEPEKRPQLKRSLVAGLGASFLAPLADRLGLAREHVVLLERQRGEREFAFELPMTPIYIGIGGLLTLATALLVFGGSLMRLIGDYLLAGVAEGSATAASFPANSMRWVGGGAMTVAVGYSLFRFMGARTSGESESDPLVELSPGQRRAQMFSIALGTIGILGWLFLRDGVNGFSVSMGAALFACCALMVVLGAILSLQIGSSASPVSGTIFVTTLVLCLVALATGRRSIDDVLILTPLLVGACVAVCTANDSSQDYKTMQLCRVPVGIGFPAQLIGLMAGCVSVPLVLNISHEAYVLGSEDLNAPQGKMFATLIDGLLLRAELPWYPILFGLAIGAAAVAMDVRGQKRGVQLPSMALAVGIYLPAYLGTGILIGSLFRFFGEGRNKQSHESILAAAGLITGAAFFELILGSIIVARPGFEESSLELLPLAEGARSIFAVGAIVVMGAILFWNSRPRRS